MTAPGEHKNVQVRILAYAQAIGWRYVPRAEAEARRGFDPDGVTPEERARKASLFFGDLLHAQVRALNPKPEGLLAEGFRRAVLSYLVQEQALSQPHARVAPQRFLGARPSAGGRAERRGKKKTRRLQGPGAHVVGENALRRQHGDGHLPLEDARLMEDRHAHVAAVRGARRRALRA